MKKKSTRRKKVSKKKKKDSPLWQWVLVAILAFALYQGLDFYLKQAPTSSDSSSPSSQATLKEVTEKDDNPIKNWNFDTAASYLPEEAYPDNYETHLVDNKRGLLAYALLEKGKQAGPQGLTNTYPGLRLVSWDGEQVNIQDLSWKETPRALGDLSKKLEGLPQISKQSIEEGETTIYPVRIFSNNEENEVMAYVKIDSEGLDWAWLRHASGKRMPAMFLLGTTATSSKQIKHRSHRGYTYLVLEIGLLDESRKYAGYQWKVQAYYWDGEKFRYDAKYSSSLTKTKLQENS